jgi:general secretion pathway protein G
MKRRQSPGFTLIEIMVVVVIIGILGALIVPNIIDRVPKARITAAQNDLRSVANALEMYKLDNFRYPSTDQGLEALVTKPSGFPEPKNYNPSGYLKKAPTDPWGTPYVYISAADGFELYSLAADGVEGGEGYDADIKYEPK